MTVNLQTFYTYFAKDKDTFYEERIQKLQEIANRAPAFSYKQREKLELLHSLWQGSASKSDEIVFVLNFIEWKHRIIHYQIIEDGQDIIVSFEKLVQVEWGK